MHSRWLSAFLLSSTLISASPAFAKPALIVAYAGSMGVVMDRYLGPTFCKIHGCAYEGQGQGAYGLAHRITARALSADVFVSVTAGPIQILKAAGLLTAAFPVASTQMVIAYSPASPYTALFRRAAHGGMPWYKILTEPGVRFGRTDPRTDPQGQNIVFTFQLAQRYYHDPKLVAHVLGPLMNARQIFSEPSLLARLEAGQIAASSGYLSAVRSVHLPYIKLPSRINLSDPRFAHSWYAHAHITLATAGLRRVLRPQPLVFYATVPTNAPHPRLGLAFIRFMQSAAGQKMLHITNYGKPHGPPLR
ncbi:MAG TPA: extracellular solute-binding protein [Acidiferrobacter sp.]|nr:extracellular solute-binding protein [Acidiferrobacter sp.]